MSDEYVVKTYRGPMGTNRVEFQVLFHFLWIFIYASPTRSMNSHGDIKVIQWAKNCWITTSGAGYFRLEEA